MVKNQENCFYVDHNLLEKNLGKHYYKVFGLQIVSDIKLPELLTTMDMPNQTEVSIRVGKVPNGITGANEKNAFYQAAKNQFLLQVPGVGQYYVTNGNSIIVEPADQGEEHSVRLFLLGTAFGALLMQRGILPIHGSAVVINGYCVIFTGESGAGKSSLLAAFRERGYSFLTDDVAAVTVDKDGVVWVHSSYPQQKQWRDSAETIGVDTVSLTPFYVGINKDKFAVPVQKGFCHAPVQLVAVYELSSENCQHVTLTPLAGMDKLAVLMNHTYRPLLINGLDLKVAHFKHCTAVAQQVAVNTLLRPAGVFSLEEQVRLVQQNLTQLLTDRAV